MRDIEDPDYLIDYRARQSVQFEPQFDSFEIHPTEAGRSSDRLSSSTREDGNLDTSQSSNANTRPRNSDLRFNMIRTNSLLSGLVQADYTNDKKFIFRLSKNKRFYLFFLVIPIMISLLFSIAILFPPGWRQKVPFLLWTDGALKKNDLGELTICPRVSICSEGVLQLIWLIISRTTAFASYAVLGLTFLSKMHCTINWLSVTHASMIIPFEDLHKVHKKTGTIYFILTILHSIGHGVRWYLRYEAIERLYTQVAISGLIGLISMTCVMLSMSSLVKTMASFETRINAHYLSLILALALCAHTGRCRYMTLIFV